MKLSPRLAAFAAAYTDALRARCKNPAPPELPPTPDFFCAQTTNYAHLPKQPINNIVHFPTSRERNDALDIIRWCMTVPKIPADSPRFAYYVSRWDVPTKIDRARCSGTLDAILANCPPIDPAWTRFVPAALAAWREFQQAHFQSKTEQAQSSAKPRLSV